MVRIRNNPTIEGLKMDSEQIPNVPEIRQDMPLSEMIDVLVASDDGRLELSTEGHQILGNLIRGKVDSCVEFHSQIEKEIERHERFASMHKDQSASLKKKLSRFEEYVQFLMTAGQFEKLPGQEFQISLSNPPGSLVVNGNAPTEDDHKNMPDFVRQTIKYEWNKAEIKKALASGNYPLSNTEIVKTRKLKFDIKKGR